MSSIFSKIIEGKIPSYKIAENEEFFAFLDIRPMALGHTLIVPRKEIDYFFDLEDDLLTRITLFSKKIAGALKKATNCNRIGVMVIGMEVPHAHIHLIPIWKEMDMNLSNERLTLSQEDFATIGEKIRAEL